MTVTPPTPDANLATRSPWFYAQAHHPERARVGWYECRYWSDKMRAWSLPVMRWWDGVYWLNGPGGLPMDFGANARDQWRGRNVP